MGEDEQKYVRIVYVPFSTKVRTLKKKVLCSLCLLEKIWEEEGKNAAENSN